MGTPSYKSVGSGYPSALSSSSSVLDSGSSRMRNMEMDMDREMGAMRREMDRDFSTGTRTSLATDPLMKYSSSSMMSPLGGSANKSESSSSSYQSKSYSATSSSVDGGLPHYSSSSDSVSRSTRTGPSNIPHTSYSHTSSSFDSDRPYRNNVSSFSYNI